MPPRRVGSDPARARQQALAEVLSRLANAENLPADRADSCAMDGPT